MIQRMITILICCACIGCATHKNAITPQQLENLHAFVSAKNMNIVSKRAAPMMTNAMQQVLSSRILGPENSGGSIDIMNTVNYVKVINDSVFVQLPFFGELQSGVTPNPDNPGIHFEGIPTKYESTYNKKKKNYRIQINFQTKRERFTLYVTLFSNLNTSINLVSSHRSSIGYRGAALLNEEK